MENLAKVLLEEPAVISLGQVSFTIISAWQKKQVALALQPTLIIVDSLFLEP